MTTPHERLRKAICFVEQLRPHICDCEDCTKRLKANTHFIANTLRALASAQSDAGKAHDTWRETLHPEFWEQKDGHKVEEAYEVGHAQGYAAGLAAQEAKCAELEAELDEVKFWHETLRVNLIEAQGERDVAEAALATAKADAEKLERFRYLYESAANDIAEKIRNWEIPITPEAHPMEQNVGTVISWADAVLSDAQDMANELRRMDELLVNLHSNPTLYMHDAIKAHAEIENNRPAAVTAAMERYTDAGNERSGE